MPRAPKVCNQAGCSALVHDRSRRRCDKHYVAWANTGTSINRSETKERKTLRRKVFERDGGMCRLRYRNVCVGIASELDRIDNLSGYSMNNCQSVCRPCHRRKSSNEGHAARWGISGSVHG